MKEIPIEGGLTTTPSVFEFGFPAAEINIVNDGANDIRASFIDNTIAAGFLIKAGETRTWRDTHNQGDRLRIYLKSASSTTSFHGEAIR